MNKRRIVQLLGEYQTRMRCDSWDIEIDFDAERPEVIADGAQASIGWAYQYDRAVLNLYEGWRKWDEPTTRRIIVHELIHLLERDLSVCIFDQEDDFDDGAWSQFYLRFNHELEGLTDRLASIIVAPDAA